MRSEIESQYGSKLRSDVEIGMEEYFQQSTFKSF